MPLNLLPTARAAALAIALNTVPFAVLAAASATLDVDLANPGHAIPPQFYGLMTEEINHSYDGGLFAELIQNRTFQDGGSKPGEPPIHWSAIGAGKVSTTTADPVNAALPVSIQLELAGGTGGVANRGYWGIPVRPATTYTATFYAKAGRGFHGKVSASLIADEGQVTIVAVETEALTDQWHKYTVTLTTPKETPVTAKARFALSASGTGTIDFSFVSLFPPTYGQVPGGLRPDLMELMAAMHPKFIRLPGGNYVEGVYFPDRFNWKKMIGPADQRPGHNGCWGYRSSDGFGLPEYLLWCKQLGAEPVLAVFAGYVLIGEHKDPGSPEMAQYTQEALEEIEYVSGPATSTWGARRAADGFPEPFPLHYVEIGNEDGFDHSGSYDGRFTQIATAIRAKYPQLKIIATATVKGFKPDLYDDHMYTSPQQMLNQFGQYDPANTKDRRDAGLNTFVGEWASQTGSPTPDFHSALGDAVYLMGMEQNSDHVEMECYAPLLANVNREDKEKGLSQGWEWSTNLIGYDALSSFGSPSYHVQSMFAANRGDVVLPVTVAVDTPAPVIDQHPTGMIGLGNYNTKSEYRDLTVTQADGKVLAADLLSHPDRWQFPDQHWEFADGTIRPPQETPGWTIAGDATWDNYTIKVKARKLSGSEGFMVLWHAKDAGHWRWWNIGGWGNTVSRCEVSDDGGRSPYGPSHPYTVETGRWYDLRLEISGRTMRGFIDNTQITEAVDEASQQPTALYATASYAKDSHDVIVKLVNTSAEPLTTKVNLHGTGTVGSTGTAYVLTGSLDAVNTTEKPNNVAPQQEALSNLGASFSRTLVPHSVTLLRFPAETK